MFGLQSGENMIMRKNQLSVSLINGTLEAVKFSFNHAVHQGTNTLGIHSIEKLYLAPYSQWHS